jgi:hypothetical protein
MSETLSRASVDHIEWQIATWLRQFERDLREIPSLSKTETEHLLAGFYGPLYEAMLALQKNKMMPMASRVLTILWCSPILGQGNIIIPVNSLDLFPIMGASANNWISLPQIDRFRPHLPERFQEAITQLERVSSALIDIKMKLREYTRARYLLAQWPGAMQFLPAHNRDSLKARSFKKKPPKKVTPLNPKTLETLAWLTMLYPPSTYLT